MHSTVVGGHTQSTLVIVLGSLLFWLPIEQGQVYLIFGCALESRSHQSAGFYEMNCSRRLPPQGSRSSEELPVSQRLTFQVRGESGK